MSAGLGKLVVVADAGLGDAEAHVAQTLGWSVVLLRVSGGESALHQTLARHEDAAVHLAIHDNARRRARGLTLLAEGRELATLIHPSAWVSPSAVIDAGAWIGAGSVVTAAAHIGVGVRLGCGVLVEHHNQVGAWSRLDAGAALAGRVTVGEGATLREAVRVRQGIAIGAWATVGVRAAVVAAVAEHATVGGIPAKAAHA
jgi:UDP-3-O-[3-hydroxymyristoyl] glucosamine N-acyltransferase